MPDHVLPLNNDEEKGAGSPSEVGFDLGTPLPELCTLSHSHPLMLKFCTSQFERSFSH